MIIIMVKDEGAKEVLEYNICWQSKSLLLAASNGEGLGGVPCTTTRTMARLAQIEIFWANFLDIDLVKLIHISSKECNLD